MTDRAALAALTAEIVECRRCPRLVAWREQVAREKVRALPRRDVLGPAGAGVRRSGRADPAARPGAGGAWREPDRAGSSPVTRRATSCGPRSTAQGWPIAPASHRADDGLTPDRRLHRGRRPLRPARQQADDRRNATRARRSWSASSALLSEVRVIVALGAFGWDAAPAGVGRARARPGAEAAVRARRGGDDRALSLARHLPPEPAEHLHGPPDARRCSTRSSGGQGRSRGFRRWDRRRRPAPRSS